MSKFSEILSATGSALLKRRAENVTTTVRESFEDKKRDLEKKQRLLKNQITDLEDLSVKSTEALVVGKNLNAQEWIEKRLDIALELRDINIELDELEKLYNEYFAEIKDNE